MARKKQAKTEADGEVEVINDTPKGSDAIDFVEYITEPNIKLGTDFRKKIEIKFDGKLMELAIRPLSSEELMRISQEAEVEGTPYNVLVVYYGAYSLSGKQIPRHILEEKIPAGIVSYIADKISDFTGYGLTDEEVEELKKH